MKHRLKGGVYFYLSSNMSPQRITTSGEGFEKIDIFVKIFQTDNSQIPYTSWWKFVWDYIYISTSSMGSTYDIHFLGSWPNHYYLESILLRSWCLRETYHFERRNPGSMKACSQPSLFLSSPSHIPFARTSSGCYSIHARHLSIYFLLLSTFFTKK